MDTVKIASEQQNLLDEYLGWFRSLVGDRRTGRLFQGIVSGIIGAESLICARIAALSPSAEHRQQQRTAKSAADGDRAGH